MVYYTGVGQGSRMAQSLAMQAPQFLSGVAGVGGAAEAEVFNLPSSGLPTTTIAAWIIRRSTKDADATESRQVEYWNANNSVTNPATTLTEAHFSTQLYGPSANPNQRVKVSTPKVDGYAGKELTQDIWDGMFATTVRFFDDDRVNGSMRANLSIADMNLVESSKEFVAGTPRRWLTYVPSNYAALVAGEGRFRSFSACTDGMAPRAGRPSPRSGMQSRKSTGSSWSARKEPAPRGTAAWIRPTPTFRSCSP